LQKGMQQYRLGQRKVIDVKAYMDWNWLRRPWMVVEKRFKETQTHNKLMYRNM
jgi:hypothetical protein